jgi:hypothetical protein
MKYELRKMQITLLPQTWRDCYTLGVLSTRISCTTSFADDIVISMTIDVKDVINILTKETKPWQ